MITYPDLLELLFSDVPEFKQYHDAVIDERHMRGSTGLIYDSVLCEFMKTVLASHDRPTRRPIIQSIFSHIEILLTDGDLSVHNVVETCFAEGVISDSDLLACAIDNAGTRFLHLLCSISDSWEIDPALLKKLFQKCESITKRNKPKA